MEAKHLLLQNVEIITSLPDKSTHYVACPATLYKAIFELSTFCTNIQHKA